MKPIRVKAFTLIELLVVIAIIAILAAMILPMMANRGDRAPGTMCMNNQKEIVLGFILWANDHDNKFPWQVSTNDDGTKELVPNNQAVFQFMPTAKLLKMTDRFVCPTDKVKSMAANIDSLSNSNISYFVNVDAALTTNSSAIILTGDRHLQAGDIPVKPGLFIFTNGIKMGWTHELHGSQPNLPAGHVSFVDGHAERITIRPTQVPDVFNRQNVASERLLVP